PLGIFLATSMFHVVHAVFLVACIWVALDASISARQMGFGDPYLAYYQIRGLSFYYLGALSVGYFSGYFLLVFGVNKSKHGPHPLVGALRLCVTAGIWLLLLAAPYVMVRKNLPHLQANKIVNRAFENYFAQIAQLLPAKGTVVLSDDPFRLYYLQATLNRRDGRSPHLLVDTGAMERETGYLGFLEKANPGYHISGPWTNIQPGAPPALASIQLLDHLSLDHGLYYMHPSFGYYSEKFYQEPQGLICQLKSYPSNLWDVPLPAKDLIAENQAFWKKTFDEVLPPLISLLEKPQYPETSNLWGKFLESAHLKPERDWLALPVGGYYSRCLDEWGVRLQETGLLAEAGKTFEQAERLNPDNAAARINKAFNQNLLAGKRTVVQVVKNMENTTFASRGGWAGVLRSDGPIDDPTYRDDYASVLVGGGNYRQAVQELDRVKTLAPDDLRPPLQLAQLFLYIQSYTNALSEFLPWTECYAAALQNTEQVLQAKPGEPTALFLKSVALIQLKQYDLALEPLNQLLSLPGQTNNYAAILNRAIAYYKVGNYKAAKPDYQVVGRVAPKAYQVYYGLGEIAYRQKETSEAIRNYELYLTNAPPKTAEAEFVSARLKELSTDTR
ncbi:MAG: Tetratricopeptide 2 repeat protein, partial [Pedosphaera sp.]|nr:Tetratricopeptide 2 repeat protein [Pedosphaera sp.]